MRADTSPGTRSGPAPLAARVPPHAWFVVSAVFHYLGPAFAVLLFPYVAPPGVAWLRIAIAAAVFAAWRRPWRFVGHMTYAERRGVVAMGVVLAAMNTAFYEAIARLPLGTVGGIEFLGPVMPSLLPATAVGIGALVLGQMPSALDGLGVALVVAGVLLHRPADAAPTASARTPDA